MTNGHRVTVHAGCAALAGFLRCAIGNNLMAKKIEINPVTVRTAFGAAQQAAVKHTRFCKVVDGKSEMKGGKCHEIHPQHVKTCLNFTQSAPPNA